MYTVYGDMLSGNCHKIKLLMRFLDIGHRWVHVDILTGATHTDEFRKMNPNAILNYLAEHAWFVGGEPTIADISLYAYTHVAPEGGFSLDGYPAVRRWCADVETIPGYVKMDRANA